MIVYYMTFLIISFLLIIYGNRRIPKKLNRLAYWGITAVLLYVAGFRYYVGTDYAQYVNNYDVYLMQELSLFSQPALAVAAKISRFIYDDFATWFFLMSAITILPVMWTIYKESCCVWLSIILYILLCCWHVPFNIVKQGAAATVLFAAYPYLRDRNLWGWCGVCLLATLFHVSALLMIPVYFLVNSNISWKRTWMIIGVGCVVWFSYDRLFDVIGFLKQGQGVIKQTSQTWASSVNLLRIAVQCVPVLLYAVFNKHYHKTEQFSCLFNMSLLNAVLNISSMNSIYLNRFCIYTIMYNMLFIPMLFQPIKRKRSTFWILPLALMLYFAFWSYDLYKCSDTVNFYWIFER